MKQFKAGDLVFIPVDLNPIWTGYGTVKKGLGENGPHGIRVPYILVNMLTGSLKGKEGGFEASKVLQAYAIPVEKDNALVGDIVRLTRKANTHERGWQNSWVEVMDNAVGEIGVVKDNSNHLLHNVEVDFPSVKKRSDGAYFGYPDFALEKLTTASPLPLGGILPCGTVNVKPAPLAPQVTPGTSSRSLLSLARGIAVELARANRFVNAAQVQNDLDIRGLGRLGNSAGKLFAGKNWRNTGTTVKSNQSSARGRRIQVWEYTGVFANVPVSSNPPVDVTTAVQATPDNVKVGSRVTLGPGYKVAGDEAARGPACVVTKIYPGRSFPVTIKHVEGPRTGAEGIVNYSEIVLI